MSAQTLTTDTIQYNARKINFLEAIELLIRNFEGRVLVSTRFTPEDQVLSHLVFKNNLPVRVVTTAAEGNYGILRDTVEYYGKNIEILNYQSAALLSAFARVHPQQFDLAGFDPLTAPLTHILSGKHVIISSRRRDTFEHPETAKPFEWDETQQQFRYYPLFYWTADQVNTYIHQQNIPHHTTLSTLETFGPKNSVVLPWKSWARQLFGRPVNYFPDLKNLLPAAGLFQPTFSTAQ